MKKKKIPQFKTDEELEAFLDQDLSPYLHKGNFSNLRFEFSPKDAKVNLRMPEHLLSAIKAEASKADMPYQRYIRHVLEQSLNS